MSPAIERISGEGVDLSPRFRRTSTVVGSPAAAVETIIASLTLDMDPFLGLGALLLASCGFTVGANGTASNLRIRRTSAAGTIIYATGATSRTAASLYSQDAIAFDTGPTLPGQVYVLTLTMTAATTESTVSAVQFVAIAV